MKKIGFIAIPITCIVVIGTVISLVDLSEPNPKTTTQIQLADDANATAESITTLVDSMNNFSFNFYQQIGTSEEGNIFFSPYSIFVALSMAYEGAEGDTAAEMQSILNILQNDSAQFGSFARVYNLLNENQDGYTIKTGNAFWAHQDYTFLPEYLSLLENFYMAEANELDFAQNVEAAETINNWIEEQTNDKIKDMIDASMLSELTKLVLTNAIYFKGLWANQFDPENTFEADFETTVDETVAVNMMSEVDGYNYTETDDLKILELNYAGDDLSMVIILPRENDISIAESAMSVENLASWIDDVHEQEIIVQIPKFKFEKKYTLNDLLKEMGVVDAFIPGVADFSGMDGARNLFISIVLHQSYVEVNEEGTEAAAATAVIMELTAIPDQKELIADHPFIFLIRHKETGAVLFMGRVTDPSE